MENEALKRKVDSLEKELQNLRTAFDVFTLHEHNGFDSSKIRTESLRTVFYKQATINPGNLADGAGETIQVTGVTGATLGDFVLVSAPYDLQDITVTAYVQANDVVEIRIQNESGGAIDLASGTWRVLVIKKIV